MAWNPRVSPTRDVKGRPYSGYFSYEYLERKFKHPRVEKGKESLYGGGLRTSVLTDQMKDSSGLPEERAGRVSPIQPSVAGKQVCATRPPFQPFPAPVPLLTTAGRVAAAAGGDACRSTSGAGAA